MDHCRYRSIASEHLHEVFRSIRCGINPLPDYVFVGRDIDIKPDPCHGFEPTPQLVLRLYGGV